MIAVTAPSPERVLVLAPTRKDGAGWTAPRVRRGLRSKQIAADLGLSVRTVEAHKYTMMQILGVHSTLELVRRSEELGLLF